MVRFWTESGKFYSTFQNIMQIDILVIFHKVSNIYPIHLKLSEVIHCTLVNITHQYFC